MPGLCRNDAAIASRLSCYKCGARLLGFESQGSLDAWGPIFFFAMIFAIAMDYTVFLLSSAREHWEASGDPREAMVGGLAHSGRVILAAGASTRMGSPKQLLALDGKPLLVRAVEAALASSAWPVVVVLGAQAEKIRPILARLPVLVAENPAWAEGMAASIRTGTCASSAVRYANRSRFDSNFPENPVCTRSLNTSLVPIAVRSFCFDSTVARSEKVRCPVKTGNW